MDTNNNNQTNYSQQPAYNSAQGYNPQQGYNAGQGYNPQQGYNMQPGYNNSQMETPMSVGDWMITLLLAIIPCVNIVILFIWAFGSDAPKSKSNYAKAVLIWSAIIIVINIVLYFTGVTTLYTYFNY